MLLTQSVADRAAVVFAVGFVSVGFVLNVYQLYPPPMSQSTSAPTCPPHFHHERRAVCTVLT